MYKNYFHEKVFIPRKKIITKSLKKKLDKNYLLTIREQQIRDIRRTFF